MSLSVTSLPTFSSMRGTIIARSFSGGKRTFRATDPATTIKTSAPATMISQRGSPKP